ncbi:polysaccharide deacetylase family protein [candidate division WOR-3 bacterium]|nr:polysaccharide deacetylase family protein [candidate division WOR-3 bacterium]
MNKKITAAALVSASISAYILKRGFFNPGAVPVLLYHDVTDGFYWTFSRSTTRMFKNQMKFLAKKKFRTVPLEKVFSGTEDLKCFSITFDDALSTVFSNAFPVLNEFSFNAEIFVVSDYVGKESLWDVNLGGLSKLHMDWDEISKLAECGWGVGSHSCTHRDLTRLSPDEVKEEAQRSMEEIMKRTGKKPEFFSYPFGRTNTSVAKIVENCGYRGALTSYPHDNFTFDPYRAGRRPVYLYDSSYDVYRRVLRSSWKNMPYDFVGRKVNFFAGGVGFYKEKILKCLRN